MKKVTIVGTGLIGCSTGIALRNKGYTVTGYDKSVDNLILAKSLGAIDIIEYSVEQALRNANIVFLATPVDCIKRSLPHFMDIVPYGCVVIDAGSTKADICRGIEDHPKRDSFVAAHPMAGCEKAGPAKADPDLFANKKVVICEQEQSSYEAIKAANKLFEDLGMTIIYLTPVEHDMTVALTSHLPQVVSYLFASMPEFESSEYKSWNRLAAGGFDSISRLASSAPEVWLPIFSQNKDLVAKALRTLSKTMNLFAENIENNDHAYMKSIINKANETRRKFNEGHNKNGNTNSRHCHTKKIQQNGNTQ